MGLDEDDSKLALACLIPRLIDPKSGRVLVDGHDLREVTLESIRAQVATVLQADLVFTDSVLVNIGLGDPMNTLPRIIEAAKLAHAHHFIQDLPHGYDTIDRPARALPQARRAVPHRAGAGLPPRSLDRDHRGAERAARRRHPALHRRHAHPAVARPDADRHAAPAVDVRSCDQVIVLHNGRVEDVGPPSQLQAESKLYRHLQYIEFNEFATGEIEAGQMIEPRRSRSARRSALLIGRPRRMTPLSTNHRRSA